MIAAEKENIDRIIATLGLKEMSQSTLIRKLCALPQHNPTRKAVFEFDKLIRSIYTLDYLRDPQLQRDVHRSQNRIEAYHQLRAAIAQVGGKKQLIGATDLDVAIANQCGRLTANVVIAYNTLLLSALLQRYRVAGDEKAIMLLRKISPVAWQHVHFLGRYLSRGSRQPIDLVALLADVALVTGAKPRATRHLPLAPTRLSTISLWPCRHPKPPPICRAPSWKPRSRRYVARCPS